MGFPKPACERDVPLILPAEQIDLLTGFTSRIDPIDDEMALAAFLGSALTSLLRRADDVPFLEAIRDGYVARAAGHTLADQKTLAADVLSAVMEMRPEIARAWAEARKRAGAEPDRTVWTGDDRRTLVQSGIEAPPAPAAPLRTAAEEAAAQFMAGLIDRRLAVLHLTAPQMPSTAYYHEQPLFLFNPVFHQVLARFLTDVVMPLCRSNYQRLAYTHLAAMSSAEAREGFLVGIQNEMEKVLAQRLAALADSHNKAEEVLAKAEELGSTAPKWKEIEVPQSRARMITVLGVRFTFGTVTTSRKVRVRADGGRDLTDDEMEALRIFTELRDMAAAEGLDLPNACDFTFIRQLLEFDRAKFAKAIKEIMALATHSMTSADFLLTRLKRLQHTLPIGLADILMLILFNDAANRGFGIADLHRACVETARDAGTLAKKRPFLHWEVARRPRELALQVREVLRQGGSVNLLETTLHMLFATWRTLSRALFENELEVALGVIAAFPIVFAGDVDETAFTSISKRLCETLSNPSPDYDSCVLAVTTTYSQVLRRHRTAGKSAMNAAPAPG